MRIPLASFPVGQQRCVPFASTSVLVCRTESGIFAVENVCPHSEFALFGGVVDNDVITCPGHGAKFDLNTGTPLTNPRLNSLKRFSVSVEGAFAVLQEAMPVGENDGGDCQPAQG